MYCLIARRRKKFTTTTRNAALLLLYVACTIITLSMMMILYGLVIQHVVPYIIRTQNSLSLMINSSNDCMTVFDGVSLLKD